MSKDTKAWGRWVESAVGTHLLNQAEELDYQIFYWREPSRKSGVQDNEVDYIIVNDGEITAIEVKSGRRGMNSGLPIFTDIFHPKKSFVVGTGGVSLEDFLRTDLENLL